MTGQPELELAIAAALDRKAKDVAVLDLRGISSFTDYFLICSGTSTRQVRALADAIGEALGPSAPRSPRLEGYAEGEWVLMDYLDFVVHVFTEEKRAFFNLEKLWRDAPRRLVTDDDSAAKPRPRRRVASRGPADD